MSTKSVKYCSRFYQGVQVDEDGQAHGPKIPLKMLLTFLWRIKLEAAIDQGPPVCERAQRGGVQTPEHIWGHK